MHVVCNCWRKTTSTTIARKLHSRRTIVNLANEPQPQRAMSTNGCDTKNSPIIQDINLANKRHLSVLPRVHTLTPINDDYERAIRDLNSLQSNTQVVALAKYKKPETILPVFRKQLSLAGIQVEDLNKLNIIHVSGTKGKGSTCAFLENILINSSEPKLKVGSYNSPHLISVTERIKINSKPVDKALFSKNFRHVFDKLKHETQRTDTTMPSYFSFLTILAFHIFLEEQIDCAIIEVGMGGEFDPTNVVEKPIACAITTLDLDHTSILGKTIEKIAWTKAGIIKPCVPIFTIEHEQDQALRVIEERAKRKDAPVFICKPIDHDDIQLGIEGSAQYINASLACQLATHLIDHLKHNTPNSPIKNGFVNQKVLQTKLDYLPNNFKTSLETCQFAGRCQIIDCPGVTFFLDGAHTRKSMENCIDWFKVASHRANGKANKYLLVNVIGERDKGEVLKPLFSFASFEHVIFSTNKISSDSDELPTSETFAKIQDQLHEKGLENAKRNAQIWTDLVREREEDKSVDRHSMPNIVVQSSTTDAIRFLQNNIPISRCGNELNNVHVLVTGSLHFVGAMLETIELLYQSK